MSEQTYDERQPLLNGQKPKDTGLRGVGWRSSPWYITSTVAVAVATDMLCYMIVVPILPFRLRDLGYTDISQHVSWLLFAYSCGIITFIFPVAFIFHRYPWRREPMLAAVVMLILALFLFMKVEVFAAMVVARFMQGAASSVVFSVGFALICENVPEKNVGRQIGFAMSGSSVGLLLAPPIGGYLYTSLGWNAPFGFCIALCVIDLLARLLVVEQRDLPAYGVPTLRDQAALEDNGEAPVVEATEVDEEELSLFGVIRALGSSRRGMTGVAMTFIFGMVDGALDPTLTLRVSEVWHKDSNFIGMIYLIAAVPTLFTGPVFGHLADKFGSEFVMPPMIAMTLPCIMMLLLDSSLIRFIASYALTSFFLNAAIAPNGLEVSMGAKETKGISEIHQFAAFNLAYATSSAIGAVAGGQMYDRTPKGWVSVIWFCFAACAAGIPITSLLAGKQPLFRRIQGIWRKREEKKQELNGTQ